MIFKREMYWNSVGFQASKPSRLWHENATQLLPSVRASKSGSETHQWPEWWVMWINLFQKWSYCFSLFRFHFADKMAIGKVRWHFSPASLECSTINGERKWSVVVLFSLVGPKAERGRIWKIRLVVCGGSCQSLFMGGEFVAMPKYVVDLCGDVGYSSSFLKVK